MTKSPEHGLQQGNLTQPDNGGTVPVMKNKLDKIIETYSTPRNTKHLDEALSEVVFVKDFEDELELWKTYGGD